MYFFEQLTTVNKTPQLHMFLLLCQIIDIIQANDVSFYFSLHENSAIEDAQFVSNFYSEDVILCAQACSREVKCFTANYKVEQKKCELSNETVEISQAAVIALRGCYLIEKVRNICYVWFSYELTSDWKQNYMQRFKCSDFFN